MPKLFSRKKGKKKSKLSIHDALAPSSAFVALPNTPPVNTTPQSPNTRQRNHFTFTPSPPPPSPRHVVLDTFTPSPPPPSPRHVVLDTFTPSPPPPSPRHVVLDTGASTALDNQDGVDSVAVEGAYSLAGIHSDYSDGDDGQGYATVRTTSFNRPRLSSPKHTLVTTLPLSQPHSSTQVTPTHLPPTIAPPKRTLSSSDLPSVTSALSTNSNSTNNSYGLAPPPPSRATPDNVTPIHSRQSHNTSYETRPTSHRKSAKQHVEVLYTEVKKPKKSSKNKETVAYSYVQHSRQPNVYHTLEPPTPHNEASPTLSQNSQSTRKKIHTNRGQSKRKSCSFDNLTGNSKHVNNKQKLPQQRHHSASQYGNDAYTTSAEESSSPIESYLQSDEISHDYHQRRHTDLSSSLNLPKHRPPASHTHRQSRQRRKSTGTLIDDPRTVPIIQPNFIQQQGNVYVFSEQLPDGRIQYYSATPVQAHTSTPPPASHPPPHTPTLPPASHPPPHTPTPPPASHPLPHTPTPPPASHPHTPTLSHPYTQHTRHNSSNLAESGYFSNHVLATGPTKPQSTSESVVISSVDGGGSTLITPIPNPTNEPQQCTHNDLASTQAKLLQSSLDSAKETSSPFLLHASLSKGEERMIIDDRGSPNTHAHLVAEYKSREEYFKARNTELEALNKEMKRDNFTLKNRLDDLTTQSDSNNDQVDCRLQTLSSENSLLCETNTGNQAKIALLENELSKVRDELASLSDENQALLVRTQASLEERGEWERVATHAHSVLDENTSLLKAQEVARETIKQLKEEHKITVSGLNGEVDELHREQRWREDALKSLRQSHTQLRARFDQLSARASRQVSLEEHQSVLMEMQRLVQELDDTNHKKLKSQEVHMRISDKDKRYLVTKLTDAKAVIYQLEGEVAQMHKTHKRAHEKMMDLQRELELARDREITLHNQLSKAVLCVEKAASERDTFAKIARSQEQAKERAVFRGAKKEAAVGKRMETHVLEQASEILHEQDKDHRHQRVQYRQEISHLKSLLAKKQTFVDKLINHK